MTVISIRFRHMLLCGFVRKPFNLQRNRSKSTSSHLQPYDNRILRAATASSSSRASSRNRMALAGPSLSLLVTALAIVGVLLPSTVSAVTCNCFNGVVVSGTACECACNAGYLQPTCTFGVADTVPLVFYLNVSASTFIAELFTNAVAYAASAPAVFVWADNVSQFSATSVEITVPGYAVSRVLTSVTVKDPWVLQFGVVSAHVVTPSTKAASSTTFDYTVYSQGNIVVTVMGIVYLAAALLLCIILVCVETSLTQNTDEYRLVESGGAGERKKKKAKKASDAEVVEPRSREYVTARPR